MHKLIEAVFDSRMLEIVRDFLLPKLISGKIRALPVAIAEGKSA
jgi:hypothetical protein